MANDQTITEVAASEDDKPQATRTSSTLFVAGLVSTVLAYIIGFVQFNDPAWQQWSVLLLVFGASPLLVAFAYTRAREN